MSPVPRSQTPPSRLALHAYSGVGGAQELSHALLEMGKLEFQYLLLFAAFVLSKSSSDDRRFNNNTLDSSVNATAINRTVATLNGIFNYYWKTDPNNKNVQFLFVCGQIGEIGTSNAGQCSCYEPKKCVNCYRWWTAILLESVASYGILMNTSNHSHVPDMIFNHSPYNAEWDPTTAYSCTYIDDFLWYGIAYLRVYDWSNVSG